MSEVYTKAQQAHACTGTLASLNSEQKNEALKRIAHAIERNRKFIQEKNEHDMARGRESGLSDALLDRLLLTSSRIDNMVEGLNILLDLPDPVGEVLRAWERENGLKVEKVRVPLGVIGMIYEARPNVTVDAVGLGLKTGNAMLLRGSSSALESNRALVHVIREALPQTDIPLAAVQLVEDTGRNTVQDMLTLNKYIDVIIPRGGAAFIQRVVNEATVPVLETGAGVCHVYIDRDARYEMACDIVINAKTDRPGVCNAVETLLVHEQWAETHLPALIGELMNSGVEVRGCPQTKRLAGNVQLASETDWDEEFLDMILAVKIVPHIDDAIAHIGRHGTRHSECIVTDNQEAADAFLQRVDAACVYHNASTRFTDGFALGFGAEIGISTQKLHARGPMGLPELTSYKYVLRGTGQVRGGGKPSC